LGKGQASPALFFLKGAGAPGFYPSKIEGSGAPEGATVTSPRIWRGALPDEETPRLPALHLRLFPGSDRAFAGYSKECPPSAGSRQRLRAGGARNRWRAKLRLRPPDRTLLHPHDAS